MPRYNPATIEPKWQKYWEENQHLRHPPTAQRAENLRARHVPLPQRGRPARRPSRRLHGHRHRLPLSADAGPQRDAPDGLGRLRPARRAACQADRHPSRASTTEQNIAKFRRQLKMLGFTYDWDRELATTEPDYFRWTQFIFLVLFDTWFDAAAAAGPADRRAADSRGSGRAGRRRRSALSGRASPGLSTRSGGQLVSRPWAPCWPTKRCQGGVSERGGHPVVRMPLRQWMLRITAYADRLENDLDGLDWPESIKLLQRNWIGRSTGAEVDFFIGTFVWRTVGKPSPREYQGWLRGSPRGRLPAEARRDVLRIYTTRPDTLFGATYMVIAPEHPLVERLTAAGAGRGGAPTIASRRPARATSTAPTWPRRRPASSPAPMRSTRSTAKRFRSGWPTTCWSATAPARSWPCRPTTRATSNSPSNSSCRSSPWSIRATRRARARRTAGRPGGLHRRRHGRQLRPLRRPAHGRVQETHRRRPASQGHGPRRRSTTSSATGSSAGSISGASRSPSCTNSTREGQPTGLVRALRPRSCRSICPHDGLRRRHDRPEPPLEKAPEDWLYVDARRQALQARNQHHAAMGRLVLVLPALPRSAERRGAGRSGGGEGVDAGRSVRRRGGARRAAPALRPLLAQGALRPRLRQHAEPFQKLVNQGMILGEMEFTATRRPGR